jgi:hypothetical protein
MAEIPASLKLAQAIEESRLTVQQWATKAGLSLRTVQRCLTHKYRSKRGRGTTITLHTSVTIQRATNGQILPEEWL